MKKSRRFKAGRAFLILAAGSALLGAAGPEDPISRVLLALVVVLPAAKVGGWLAERIRQPAVLGELAAGMAIGNIGLLGLHGLEYLQSDAAIEVLANLGVILLLFEIGLESSLAGLVKVGLSSLLVAAVGVVLPFFLGWGVSARLLPEHGAARARAGRPGRDRGHDLCGRAIVLLSARVSGACPPRADRRCIRRRVDPQRHALERIRRRGRTLPGRPAASGLGVYGAGLFVQMGLKMDASWLARPEILGLALVLIAAALAGKQACGLAAVERGLNRVAVGVGMIPRGEVGST